MQGLPNIYLFCKEFNIFNNTGAQMFHSNYHITPASNLGYLAPPPGQFFMGAKLFIGTPWMGNEGVLKKNLVWAM